MTSICFRYRSVIYNNRLQRPSSTTIFDAGLAGAFCGVRFLPTLVLLALEFIRAVPPFVWVTVDIIARSGHGVISNVDCSQIRRLACYDRVAYNRYLE